MDADLLDRFLGCFTHIMSHLGIIDGCPQKFCSYNISMIISMLMILVIV